MASTSTTYEWNDDERDIHDYLPSIISKKRAEPKHIPVWVLLKEMYDEDYNKLYKYSCPSTPSLPRFNLKSAMELFPIDAYDDESDMDVEVASDVDQEFEEQEEPPKSQQNPAEGTAIVSEAAQSVEISSRIIEFYYV